MVHVPARRLLSFFTISKSKRNRLKIRSRVKQTEHTKDLVPYGLINPRRLIGRALCRECFPELSQTCIDEAFPGSPSTRLIVKPWTRIENTTTAHVIITRTSREEPGGRKGQRDGNPAAQATPGQDRHRAGSKLPDEAEQPDLEHDAHSPHCPLPISKQGTVRNITIRLVDR